MSEFLTVIKPEHNLKRLQTLNNIRKTIPVYILSKSSLIYYPYIDIKKLIFNHLSAEIKRSINQDNIFISYDCNAILSQKNYKEELFIANKEYLKKIGFNVQRLPEPIVYYLINSANQKFLNFTKEKIALMIEEQSTAKVNKLNNRNANNNNIFENTNVINNINANANNNNLQNINKIDNINIKNKNLILSEKKINNNIFDAIILLYANEIEIRKLFSTITYEDRITKIYYLISKKWIDEFKAKYNYTYVSDILSKYYQYGNYISYEQNLQLFKSIIL